LPLNLPASGQAWRISISQDGLYRLGYADLQAAGLPVETLNPLHLHLTTQEQAVALWIDGEEDGHFDPGDDLYFYGQHFDGARMAAAEAGEEALWFTFPNGWHPTMDAAHFERVTNENVYWLSLESTPGLRMAARSAAPGSAALETSAPITVRAETQAVWWPYSFTGADTWFWEKVADTAPHTYTINLPGLAPGASAQLHAEMVARSTGSHHTHLTFNGQLVDDAVWNGQTRRSLTASLDAAWLQNGENSLTLSLQTGDNLYFDWFAVTATRQLSLKDGLLTFCPAESTARRYQVSGMSGADPWLLDLTDPLQPVRLSGGELSGGALTFESAGAPACFAIFEPASLLTPVLQAVSLVDLLATSNQASEIIIAPPRYLASAQRLADYRSTHGLSARVVNLEDVYNLFTGGIRHPVAIRRFLKYAAQHWQAPAPAYVILVGDGHWNFQGYNSAVYGNPLNEMPPYLAWIDGTLGETDAPNLLASFDFTSRVPGLAIGRIPVSSPEELDAVIDKIIAYEETPYDQLWQNRVVFAADNNHDSAGDFAVLSDELAASLSGSPLWAQKIYLENYGCPDSGGACGATATQALLDDLNQTGASLLVYSGHGWSWGWADEQFLTTSHIPSLQNQARLPVLLSLTCMDGYWHSPGYGTLQAGLAEELLRAPQGGVVAALSPAGYAYAEDHQVMALAFLNALARGGQRRLGDAALTAYQSLAEAGVGADILSSTVLFGDPALNIKITSSQVYLPQAFHP